MAGDTLGRVISLTAMLILSDGQEYTRDELMALSDPMIRASAKSLPSEVKTVRLVEIVGIDKNPCCGTHVPSASYLQVLSLCLNVLQSVIALNHEDHGSNDGLVCDGDQFASTVDGQIHTSRAPERREDSAALRGW